MTGRLVAAAVVLLFAIGFFGPALMRPAPAPEQSAQTETSPLSQTSPQMPAEDGMAPADDIGPPPAEAAAREQLPFDLDSQVAAIKPETRIQKVVSPGGLEAWLVEEHAVPLIAVEVGFKGGSDLDPKGKEGVTRLMSTLFDEGAGDLTSEQFQRKLDELAIRMSFDADRDGVYASMRTIADRKDQAFDMLRLALTQPRFDPEPIERMRQQMLVQIREDDTSPDVIAQLALFRQLFDGHPYARPIKGTEESLKSVTRADLKARAAQALSKDRMKIAVVGAISADELGPLLDRSFGALPDTTPQTVPEAKVADTGRLVVYQREQPQSVAMFGRQGLKIDDPDFIPAFVMNYILGGGGFSSRLMEEVREKKGLAYGVYTYLVPFDHGALFLGSVGTDNARIADTIAIIKQEFDRLRNGGVTAKELEDAKTYLTGSFPLRFDSNSKIANQLVGYQLTGRPIDYINKRNDLIEKVTTADIARVAKRLLHSDDLTFVVVGEPKGLHPDQVIPVTPAKPVTQNNPVMQTGPVIPTGPETPAR